MRAFACTRDTEERGRENGLWLAKPSFAARPVRLDPSHFYHPGFATTDESRIGCGGTNEGDGGEEGGPEGQERQSASCRVPLAPLRAALRVSLLASPFLRRTNQPAALSLQLFAGVQPPRDSERRTQRPRRALTQPPVSRLPKAVPNVARRLACTLPPPSPASAHQPRQRVLPSQPEVHPSHPLARSAAPTAATARGRHERPYERTSRLHRPREKIASLRFKCYEWRAWQIARWLLSRLAKFARSTAAMHALHSRCDTVIIATKREGDSQQHFGT